jgi:hypothetical protein
MAPPGRLRRSPFSTRLHPMLQQPRLDRTRSNLRTCVADHDSVHAIRPLNLRRPTIPSPSPHWKRTWTFYVAEPPELFQLKCASHRYTADINSTHFKWNNSLVCRVSAQCNHGSTGSKQVYLARRRVYSRSIAHQLLIHRVLNIITNRFKLKVINKHCLKRQAKHACQVPSKTEYINTPHDLTGSWYT